MDMSNTVIVIGIVVTYAVFLILVHSYMNKKEPEEKYQSDDMYVTWRKL